MDNGLIVKKLKLEYSLLKSSLEYFLSRHRYISATCSMAILKDVPQEVLFRVLIDRINIVTLLPWLRATNAAPGDQLNFMMAGNDKKQWEVSLSGTSKQQDTA